MIVQRSIDKIELQQAAEGICRNYCKYPEIWDETAMECELRDSHICENCPMAELLENVVIATEEHIEVVYLDGKGFRMKEDGTVIDI